MSQVINSDGTVPQATQGYNPLAISSSTNATPIEITTGSNHGYNDGDTVGIENHKVNTSANGLWRITKTALNKFTLDGSVGVGVGGATGYSIDYAVNPLITVPADLDLVDAASVNPAFEALFDLSPYMYKRVGAYNLFNIFRGDKSDALDQGTVATASVPNTATWTDLGASFAYQWSFGRDIQVLNTDILLIEFHAFVVVGTGGQVNGVALAANLNGGGMTMITGTARAIYAASTQRDMTLTGRLYASDIIASGPTSLAFGVMGYNGGVANQTFTLENPYHLNIAHYRLNA